jgi:uncharacterized protein YndB with AHSA1/START domain
MRQMGTVTRTVWINAPTQVVWEAAIDVEEWPRWASYMNKLTKQNPGSFALGSRVRVDPKGMPGSVWTVTEYDPPRSYTWTTQLAPGLGLVGGHVLEPKEQGTTTTFYLATNGPIGAVLSPLLSIVFRRNTRLATTGLKRHCEEQERAQASRINAE